MGRQDSPYRAEEALAGLKDFQRRTVDYVFDRFYGGDSVSRFLVADEVGLGKTLVARGIVAKTIEHLQTQGVGRIDILYVCSNSAIATQNISRLKVSAAGNYAKATRLTYLPKEVRSLRKKAVNFVSLTPQTAFDHVKSRGGHAEERAIIYRILHGMRWTQGSRRRRLQRGLLNMLQGTVRNREYWRNRIDRIMQKQFASDLEVAFRRAAEADDQLHASLEECCERFHRHRDMNRVPWSEQDQRLDLIGQLRGLLAEVCLHALKPALVILDEFQRFKYLLDGQDETALLAQALFRHPEVRVLLLSATPYKMYTLDAEMGEEDHYPDFVRTLRFLYDDEPALAKTKALIDARRKMIQEPALDGDALRLHSESLRKELLKVMCRTERADTTRDHNAMLEERRDTTDLEPEDLLHAAFADSAARSVGSGDVTEYWKSTPYLLNFLKSYDLRRKLDQKASSPPIGLIDCMRSQNGQLLRRRTIERYEKLDPGNARMRALIRDTIDKGLWRLLWMPPAMPYSRPSGPYEAMQDTTKALVFSSWTAVPDAIAAICSYEAERRMVGSAGVGHSQLHTRVPQLLRFSRSSIDGRLTGMPVLAWMMPTPTLAAAVDPLRIALTRGHGQPLDQDAMLREAVNICRELLDKLPQGTSGTRVDERWYWAAPALLESKSGVAAWLMANDGWRAVSSGAELGTAFHEHVEFLAEIMEDEDELGPRPEDLPEVLAKLALAGPGTCALRALSRIAPDIALDNPDMLSSAARVSSGFRSLFNMPETIAMLRGSEDSYWRRTLEYALDGNIQAVLDEYVHTLPESLGVQSCSDCETVKAVSSHVQGTLSLRVAQVRIDELQLANKHIEVSSFNTRTRFALRFGDIRDDEGSAVVRATGVRDTFNSPFRPFILASTSIGQEGLDFHTWCHAVVHWNLPSNPVDLEQREGRVHRYKGHAIRKNIAERYGLPALRDWSCTGDPWKFLFGLAERDRRPGISDLVPHWVFDEGSSHVERRVPVLPFSREIERFSRLKRGLALYRVVFGQPRQEDLLAHLEKREGLRGEELMAWLVSLAPPE